MATASVTTSYNIFSIFFFLPNIVIECVKRVQYINNVSKKTCFGWFRIEKDMKKDNETGLKEEKGIEIEIYIP